MKFRVARYALAILVVATLIGFAAQKLDAGALLHELSGAQWPWLAAGVFAFVSILPLWAWQWMILAEQQGSRAYVAMLAVVCGTSSIMNSTAFLVGEAAAVMLLTLHAKVNRYQALSLLALDQFLVGCAKLVVIGIAATQVALPAAVRSAVIGLVGGVAVIGCGGLLMALQRDATSAWGRIGQRLTSFRHPARLVVPLAIALTKKGVEVLAILCVQRAFGLDIPIGSAVVILAMTNLATLLPVVPGNIGVYEGAVAFAYMQYGISPERAVAMAGVQHLCYFIALATPGYVWGVRKASLRSVPAIS